MIDFAGNPAKYGNASPFETPTTQAGLNDMVDGNYGIFMARGGDYQCNVVTGYGGPTGTGPAPWGAGPVWLSRCGSFSPWRDGARDVGLARVGTLVRDEHFGPSGNEFGYVRSRWLQTNTPRRRRQPPPSFSLLDSIHNVHDAYDVVVLDEGDLPPEGPDPAVFEASVASCRLDDVAAPFNRIAFGADGGDLAEEFVQGWLACMAPAFAHYGVSLVVETIETSRDGLVVLVDPTMIAATRACAAFPAPEIPMLVGDGSLDEWPGRVMVRYVAGKVRYLHGSQSGELGRRTLTRTVAGVPGGVIGIYHPNRVMPAHPGGLDDEGSLIQPLVLVGDPCPEAGALRIGSARGVFPG
ncbi:hypothetical protein KGQ19_06155 [Catenulispora sp. NL8]|uniref:Uncharacterized protein n=1 Tax=Catenulispora pinistramenti TaxID=2705254 RepID=A0ABS5KJ67_9ACTN|nr:hypothetical protein [Catenulispora pinistramenti]MBS2546444.1 hypothetical protein [Catenulispora pinistramenti]